MCISSSIIYAYYAAFRYDIEANHSLGEGHPRYIEAHAKHNFSNEQIEIMDDMMLVIESVMLIDFLIHFCLEYKEIDKTEPIRELSKTALRYAQNEMVYDLVPLIPFQFIFFFRYSRLFFLIKCFRTKKSLALLDASKFMEIVLPVF